MHCDTVISPEPTGITAVITIRYWLLCFWDSNQNRNLQPRAHMLYEFLLLIDEHNTACQKSLALEKCWMTKSCWNRIITTLLGMAVVDVQRWDRNKRHGYMMRPPSGFGDDDDDGVMDDFDIKTMANLIGRPLTDGRFKYYRKSN